ncbi:Gfo/Idh/MocA family oxidoreductase [Rhodobacteraceae bacterium]|nr:Gfo/Idh/MocA family oxidoreductase [Paracoccaceae bacterium]
MSIGVALLGITHPHTSGRAEIFSRLPDVELIGAFDRDAVIEPFCEHMGLPTREPDDLINDPAVQIVLVHAQTEEMTEYCTAALKAGKSVLVEKPCGTGPEDIKKLIEAEKASSAVFQAGFNFRFSPIVDMMKKVVEGGIIGDITQVRAHGGCALGEHKTPMLNREQDIGGAFFVIGCHVVDILLHVLGAPKEVAATVAKFPKISDHTSREDSVAACLVYENCLASIDFAAQDPLENVESWDFFFNGTEGVLYGNLLPGRYKLFLKRPFGGYPAGWSTWLGTQFPVPWSGEPTEFSPDIPAVANQDFFDREAAQFMAAFRGETPSPISASHAHLVARTIDTCYRSSDDGGCRTPLL